MFDATYSSGQQLSLFPMVVGFFTPNINEKVHRLKQSLDLFELPYRLCQVSDVHSTITTQGSEKSLTVKSRFIRYWLDKLMAPVLYLDCDLVLRSYPEKIMELASSPCALATFNWLSGEENCTYFPSATSDGDKVYEEKSYVKGFEITVKSTDQIICSGAVQFWRFQPEALHLLETWEEYTQSYPKSRDDHLLDLSFNFFKERKQLNFFSLPRSYCRYAWWPEVHAVIDHPEFPKVNQPWEELLESRVKTSATQNHLTQRF